jgi:hypothetical protein
LVRAGSLKARGACAAATAATLALGFASSAGAHQSAIIDLGLNQVVQVANSSIGCGTRSSSGTPYIYCTSSRSSAAYVAILAANGRVEVVSVKTHKAAFNRAPAGVETRNGTPTAQLKDLVVVTGTSILCDVLTVSGKPTMLCEYVNKKGDARPNSYSFGISDTIVSSLEWDAAGKLHVLHTWAES